MSDSEGEWLSAQNPPIDTRNPCTSITMGVVSSVQRGCNDSDSDGPWLSAAVGSSHVVTTRIEATPLKVHDTFGRGASEGELEDSDGPWMTSARAPIDGTRPAQRIPVKKRKKIPTPTIEASGFNVIPTCSHATRRATKYSWRKRQADSTRTKETRSRMQGYETPEMKSFYDMMGLNDEERKQRVNDVSRLRGFGDRPPTPPGYWDVDFPTIDQQVARGLFKVVDAPPAYARTVGPRLAALMEAESKK